MTHHLLYFLFPVANGVFVHKWGKKLWLGLG